MKSFLKELHVPLHKVSLLWAILYTHYHPPRWQHGLPSSKMAARTTILQDGTTDYHPPRWQHGLPSSKMAAQTTILQDGSTDYHPPRWHHGLPSSKMAARTTILQDGSTSFSIVSAYDLLFSFVFLCIDISSTAIHTLNLSLHLGIVYW